MKFKLLALLLLLFSLTAFSARLTLMPNANSYLKGETILIKGSCTNSMPVSLSFALNEKHLYSTELECRNESYSFSYKTSFLDPKGLWTVIAINAGETVQRKIQMNPSKESEYFLVAFLSPTEIAQNKGDKISISIKVTDAGIPVTDANVFFWTIEGKRLALENKGNGIYSYDFFIPFDANITEWTLIVVAEGFSGNLKAGGEASIRVPIENAVVKLELIKPEIQTFELSSHIDVVVNASYANGNELIGAKVIASLDDTNFSLTKKNATTFEGIISLEKFIDGTKELKITATDKYGNYSVIKKPIVLRKGFLSFLADYVLAVAFIIVILLFALLLYFFTIKKHIAVERLQKEKESLENELKQLQDNFFNKNMYSIAEYKQKLSEIQRKLTEISKKLEIK